jgi:hypothetical protein
VPHLPDLGTSTPIASGPCVRSVGWLSSAHPFPKGKSPPEVIAKLRELTSTWEESTEAMNWPAACGSHECEICHAFRAGGNLAVPSATVLFVAPEMIAHYVEVHEYLPPQAFINAVMVCPLASTHEYAIAVAPFVDRKLDTSPP